MGIAYKSKCLDYTVYGKSEQETREGYNLLNIQDGTKESSGCTLTFKNGIGTFTGASSSNTGIVFSCQQTIKAGTYTLWNGGEKNYSYPYIILRGSNNENLVSMEYSDNGIKVFTLDNDVEVKEAYFWIATVTPARVPTITPMLLKGVYTYDMLPKFEQCGASPSPDYPSEIKTIPSVVNLLDIADGTYTKGGLTITFKNNVANITGTITETFEQVFPLSDNFTIKAGTYTLSGNTNTHYPYINLKKDNVNQIQVGYDDNGTKTFTIEEDIIIDSVGLYFRDTISYAKKVEVQLEKGSIAHPYVPFGYYLRIDDVGKNRIKLIERTVTSNGITATVKGDTITFNGDCNADSTIFDTLFSLTDSNIISQNNTLSVYYVSGSCINSGTTVNAPYFNLYDSSFNNQLSVIQLYNLNSNNKILYSTRNQTTSYEAVKNRFRFDIGVSCDNFTIKIMLTDDVEVKYEPYRAPKNYFIDLAKKNLFDKDNPKIFEGYINAPLKVFTADVNGFKTLYVPCKPNTTYTISKIKSERFRLGYCTEIPIDNGTLTYAVDASSDTSYTLTTDNNSKYLCVFYYNVAVDTLSEEEIKNSIKIYEGVGTEDHYELCSTKDLSVRDELIIENGYARIEKNIQKDIYDGTQAWGMDYGIGLFNNIVSRGISSQNKALCTHATFDDRTSGMASLQNGTFAMQSRYGTIFVRNNNCTNVDDFINWLKEQNENDIPLAVYYLLANPYTIDLGQVDFPLIDGEIKGIAYNGKQIKGIAYGGKTIFTAQD